MSVAAAAGAEDEGGSRRRRAASPIISASRPAVVPRMTVYKQLHPINSLFDHVSVQPRERLLAFLSGAEDNHVWDRTVLTNLPRFLSVFKMTGENLGYKGQLQILQNDLGGIEGTSTTLYHSEQWIYLALKAHYFKNNLVYQLKSCIEQIIGRGTSPIIEAIFMHIHSTNDVCDKCTVSLSKLMGPANLVRNSFLRELTGQDNFRNFLIIASSRVGYMGRRMKVGHDISYAQCLRDQLEILPDPEQDFPVGVTRLNVTTININDLIDRNQFIHFVMPDWPAPQGIFIGRGRDFSLLTLSVGRSRGNGAAAAAAVGDIGGAEDEVHALSSSDD